MAMPPETLQEFLHRSDDQTIAFRRHQPHPPDDRPGIVFLSGFRSDMMGTKALALHEWAIGARRKFLRFDYFGHGASSGEFAKGNISRWLEDTLSILDEVTQGPQILVGSSMGGWLALLAAKARPERIKALVLIAPAPDFTEALMWKGFSEEVRTAILNEGVWQQPSVYDDEPTLITRQLIEDGRKYLLLDKEYYFAGPVRILQGLADPDIPWRHALQLVECLRASDVTLTLIKNGDHRLSSENDLARLIRMVEEF
jgi:pimeloyl-ACP methyl ester carboxylesterase